MFFECGPGWTQLIRDLCSKLEPICLQQREAVEEFVPVAAQVKSKYGGLRFYVDGGTDESDELTPRPSCALSRSARPAEATTHTRNAPAAQRERAPEIRGSFTLRFPVACRWLATF